MLSQPLQAQGEINIKKVRNSIEKYIASVAAYGNAGQVLVARHSEVMVNLSYGYANREAQEPVQPNTIFEIASVSKMFTAAAILKLQSEGKLSVSDKISDFFENVPPDKNTITIHQLLTHSSGIRGGDLAADFENISKPDLVSRILVSPLRTAPGAKWIYSNAGYNLLAAIIEKQSGKTYDQYLTDTFFKPLKMASSGVNNTPFLLGKPVATAYQGNKNNGNAKAQHFNPRTWGGGSVCSTVSDLYMWERALHAGKVLPGKELVLMFAQHIPAGNDGYTYYGYGLFNYKNPADNNTVIDHGGDTERGFNATFRMFRDINLTYIFVSNAQQPGGTWDRWFMDRNIRNLVYGQPVTMPPAVMKTSRDELQKYAGAYYYNDSKLEVSILGNNLVIEADGEDAVNLLYGFTEEQKNKISIIQKSLSKILDDYKNGTAHGLEEFLSERGRSDFIEERAMLTEKFGQLRNYHIQGTFPDARDPNFWICAARLEYEKRTVSYFSMWLLNADDNITLDFATADLESRINLRFARTGVDSFTSYNFFSDKATTLDFMKSSDGKTSIRCNDGQEIFYKK
ncbi:MAG: beta-lactamase family protein [Cyclobacteriaceae bacterium]|nr:beta-lactamase family protein [Cyclobacteriaceae bacterium]